MTLPWRQVCTLCLHHRAHVKRDMEGWTASWLTLRGRCCRRRKDHSASPRADPGLVPCPQACSTGLVCKQLYPICEARRHNIAHFCRPLVLREVLVYPTLPFKPPVHQAVTIDDQSAPPVRTYLPLYFESLNVAAELYAPVCVSPYILREGIFRDILQVCCGPPPPPSPSPLCTSVYHILTCPRPQALRPALQCKHGDTPDIWRSAMSTLIRIMDAALPGLVRQTEGMGTSAFRVLGNSNDSLDNTNVVGSEQRQLTDDTWRLLFAITAEYLFPPRCGPLQSHIVGWSSLPMRMLSNADVRAEMWDWTSMYGTRSWTCSWSRFSASTSFPTPASWICHSSKCSWRPSSEVRRHWPAMVRS